MTDPRSSVIDFLKRRTKGTIGLTALSCDFQDPSFRHALQELGFASEFDTAAWDDVSAFLILKGMADVLRSRTLLYFPRGTQTDNSKIAQKAADTFIDTRSILSPDQRPEHLLGAALAECGWQVILVNGDGSVSKVLPGPAADFEPLHSSWYSHRKRLAKAPLDRHEDRTQIDAILCYDEAALRSFRFSSVTLSESTLMILRGGVSRIIKHEELLEENVELQLGRTIEQHSVNAAHSLLSDCPTPIVIIDTHIGDLSFLDVAQSRPSSLWKPCLVRECGGVAALFFTQGRVADTYAARCRDA